MFILLFNKRIDIYVSNYSTEQSSPSTLSSSSNQARRFPRAHRHLSHHQKAFRNHGFSGKVTRYRQPRNQIANHSPSGSNNRNGGMVMLKNGIVLSPSQLQGWKEKSDSNLQMVHFPTNGACSNNQITVVVVENRSSSGTEKIKSGVKIGCQDNACNETEEAKYSDTTTPIYSTSSSSSSSPSNMRCNAMSNNSSNPNSNWAEQLDR